MLTPDNVDSIIDDLEAQMTQTEIAKKYSISDQMVYYIKKGEKWKTITREQKVEFEGGFIIVTITYDPRTTAKSMKQRIHTLMKGMKNCANAL